VESLLDLFEQETEDMIDAIEESRMELRGTMLDFEDETEQLRAESRMLGVKMSKIMMNGGGIVCDILIGFKTNVL
jgi:hypothetical protein